MRIPSTVRSAALAAVVSLAGSALVFTGSSAQTADKSGGRDEWVGSWSTGIVKPESAGFTATGLNNQSARYVVRPSVGGDKIRIRFTNIYGDRPVQIGAATVAKGDTSTPVQSDIDVASKRSLTFNGGSPTAVMNKGAELLSDPINLEVPDLSTLVISVFYPTATGPTSWHASSNQQNFFGPGDLTGAADGTPYITTRACCWTFLSGVDVVTDKPSGSIVVLGDSIADGLLSTANANNRWPDQLAERLVAERGKKAPGVLNVGEAGNRLLQDSSGLILGGPSGTEQLGLNALARLNEDVYAQTDVRTVITHLGVNDIWMNGAGADEIIAALKQINSQLLEKNIGSIGATITPYAGFTTPGGWTPEKEATRVAVNTWLRTQDEFDGIIDFDKAVRDPASPDKLLAAYDGGDHIHMSDAGYQAMANSIPLKLVR
ncbi:SGNH/GDSL hydrolase family protein [Streptomyces sp. SID13031]|uniref:SGNH/GDSL hydrolase family protein n=1 Tax=Streptomyces sp. SID13031 TaxID=2706046 RepID=UPI0013CD8CD0|nr:SGNH/GDSL hydrolase family protein [Streptomyces sp. SID13031]NEA34116.1 SGNH/GDSL hydrolase family protein [Streptomyces sp. SID13031]